MVIGGWVTAFLQALYADVSGEVKVGEEHSHTIYWSGDEGSY